MVNDGVSVGLLMTVSKSKKIDTRSVSFSLPYIRSAYLKKLNGILYRILMRHLAMRHTYVKHDSLMKGAWLFGQMCSLLILCLYIRPISHITQAKA